MNLEPPASHHLSSAQGWLELGNAEEAQAELDQIAAEFHTHPEVMEVRWQVLAQLKHWQECVDLGMEFLKLFPSKSTGWVHRAYALHEMGDTQGALNELLPALKRFPDSWLVRYNLACYYCRLKQNEEALRLFEQACRLGDVKHLKEMAMEDADLEPIRDKIASTFTGGYI